MTSIEILFKVHDCMTDFKRIEDQLRRMSVHDNKPEIDSGIKEIRAIINKRSEKFQPLLIELNKLTQERC
jgi:hypothetical protein